MTTAELRAHLLQVDPEGTLPVYVEMDDEGWCSLGVSVYASHLDFWESDEEDGPDTGIPVVKIGKLERLIG